MWRGIVAGAAMLLAGCASITRGTQSQVQITWPPFNSARARDSLIPFAELGALPEFLQEK